MLRCHRWFIWKVSFSFQLSQVTLIILNVFEKIIKNIWHSTLLLLRSHQIEQFVLIYDSRHGAIQRHRDWFWEGVVSVFLREIQYWVVKSVIFCHRYFKTTRNDLQSQILLMCAAGHLRSVLASGVINKFVH